MIGENSDKALMSIFDRRKIMTYIYKISGKISMVLYIFILYQLWHLCQYGSLQNHFPKLAMGMIGFAITFVLWMIARKYHRKTDRDDAVKKKILHIEFLVFITATLFFGGGIVYSAIPYHGALSWKVDEWMRKKEIMLEHNNIYETGVEGILLDLNEVLELPEELYIVNEYQVTFDENGTIQSIYAFLYGKDADGKKKTYLIDYDADSSDYMTVWTDGNANGEYEEGMRLSPMIEILKNADWINQVKRWAENFEEPQIYEVFYAGRRYFNSEEGLQYIPGDADGDGVQTGTSHFEQLRNGSEIIGFEVSLYIPELDNVTPVRYIMEPEYVSQEELKQENTIQQVEGAKDTESWTTDQSDGTMYFFSDDQNGWRLVVADAAAGSRFYVMEKTVDGGTTWEPINEDPFSGQLGVAEGLVFFDEEFGVIGLMGASQSYSALYVTRNGGVSFEKMEFPMSTVTELPELAEESGFTVADYDYLYMPENDGDVLTILVTTDADESDGIIFQSTDSGVTWEYNGITSKTN